MLLLKVGDYMTTLKLKDTYFNIPIHQANRQYPRFCFKSNVKKSHLYPQQNQAFLGATFSADGGKAVVLNARLNMRPPKEVLPDHDYKQQGTGII